MKLDPDAIPRGNQTLDPRGVAPQLIAIKSENCSWKSYTTVDEFQQGPHRDLFDEDDYAFGILWKMGHSQIAVCEFANIEQLCGQLASTMYSVNKAWGGVNVYPRRWTSADIQAFIELQTGNRMTVRASLQLSSEFCLTEEFRHLYPR